MEAHPFYVVEIAMTVWRARLPRAGATAPRMHAPRPASHTAIRKDSTCEPCHSYRGAVCPIPEWTAGLTAPQYPGMPYLDR
jgi:hypothetical protein